MYNCYVTKIKDLRKHPNADRLQVGECFGNTVCVDLSYKPDTLGVYFPTDGQLSVEFCEANNLVRKKDEKGKDIGGYLDPDKRNIKTIRLRGEPSDGLFLPITCLESFGDYTSLKEGDIVTIFNGVNIACKYIPRRNHSRNNPPTNKTRKKKVNIAPLFAEHADTAQLAYNLGNFRKGDSLELTLKMHGTSQRTGYLPVLKGYKRSLFDKIFRRKGTPIYEYDYICGTRRTVLEDNRTNKGFYGSNEFREDSHSDFYGKLMKGETVYYEVVGYTDTNMPIMSTCDNKKIGKDFVKQYGETTTFNYGCEPYCNDFYVYRMTMTNEDGFVVEYTPEFMRYRCEQMGVKTVPVFEKTTISEDCEDIPAFVTELAEKYYDGRDPVGLTHIREGVVVRITNCPSFTAYKHKNLNFKILEGIVKNDATAPDMEEAEDELNE